MPTIVGFLTFINMINTTSKRTYLFDGILIFMISWNFVLSLVEHEKKFYNLGLMHFSLTN